MISGALVGFRMGTTVSSRRETPSTAISGGRFLACQMPECQASRFFRLLAAMACLDNLVAGIPNAIKSREDANVE
jgi:hypothetical protein